MKNFSFTKRVVAAATALAVVAGGLSAIPAQAVSSELETLSSNLSSGGSSGFTGLCEAQDSLSCEADNGGVEARVTPTVIGNIVTTTIDVTGIRNTSENIVLNYQTAGIQLDDVEVIGGTRNVRIDEGTNAYKITIDGGLRANESVQLQSAGTVTDPERITQNLMVVTGNPDLNFWPVLAVIAAVGGGFAGIEHLHNIRALPREVDKVWLFITGRNPNLTLGG